MSYYSLSGEMKATDSRHHIWKDQRDKRGFDDTELWNLDLTICKFIHPRLVAFRERLGSHPGVLTMEEWEHILDDMIDGFDPESFEFSSENNKVVEAFSLLAEWHGHLWN